MNWVFLLGALLAATIGQGRPYGSDKDAAMKPPRKKPRVGTGSRGMGQGGASRSEVTYIITKNNGETKRCPYPCKDVFAWMDKPDVADGNDFEQLLQEHQRSSVLFARNKRSVFMKYEEKKDGWIQLGKQADWIDWHEGFLYVLDPAGKMWKWDRINADYVPPDRFQPPNWQPVLPPRIKGRVVMFEKSDHNRLWAVDTEGHIWTFREKQDKEWHATKMNQGAHVDWLSVSKEKQTGAEVVFVCIKGQIKYAKFDWKTLVLDDWQPFYGYDEGNSFKRVTVRNHQLAAITAEGNLMLAAEFPEEGQKEKPFRLVGNLVSNVSLLRPLIGSTRGVRHAEL